MRIDREQLATDIERELAAQFENASLIGFLRTGFGSTTRTIKEFIGKLGHDRGFQVAASGLVGAEEGEWLYDMVWYELEGGFMTQQVLVMECELNCDPQLDGDFQKLVQARAGVRLWISCSPNSSLAKTHLANCKRQAVLFSGAVPGDTYVFVTDNWTDPKTSVERFTIGSST
jgi:hypothetical protein